MIAVQLPSPPGLVDALNVMRPSARLRRQAEALAGYLDEGDTVLDVGCGTGHLSAYLQQMYGVDASGVDVQDSRKTPISFRLFDGTAIPYCDSAFDHIVLSEVLHHSHDPAALVKECHRVARRSVMVFEDMPDGRLGKLILRAHVELFARYYRYPFPPANIGAYRCALNWLGQNASRVKRFPQPPEWLSVYPRVLSVYLLKFKPPSASRSS
ncbi:SAM-dependent methyltransferase [Mycobacterium kansasii]|uniref:2-methyl-6-phytyl-1,4-hydroquinone methyltransferase n=1 Tax=Mycobacterium innocens TaxID=2341083 RepID=A0A498Q8C3_9MYCO|nr:MULTISPECIES: class I SAM-dependent methyltransferase [Mycobacterium]KZS74517.1 SAM-dependent methyltransferase [Mycobacterium kansasii]VBA40822.1 2-methyl-6-phytyl-1,4-hydroquinone methyltransferase [Mycobacterium innocens]